MREKQNEWPFVLNKWMFGFRLMQLLRESASKYPRRAMTPTEVLAFYNSEMRAHPPREAGVKHERVGRILRVCGPFNRILYSDLTSADADAAIAEQAAFFRTMNAEVEWKVYGHDLPADLGERLRAAGFKPDEAETLMAFDLSNPLPINAQAGIEIRRVVDAAGLQDVIVVSNAAFGCDHGWMMQTFGPRVTDPTLSLHVAYSGASPVSAARMELPPGRSFASLWGGGTIPSHRGLGIYRELTAIRTRTAHERGYRFLTVDAQESSRPILERLGFMPLTSVTGWRL
jgi:hypothetical protein